MENFGVALMGMVNELAGRYGLRPCDFVAALYQSPEGRAGAELRFETIPKPPKDAGFDKMLVNLGARDSLTVAGSDESIYEAVEAALERAPPKSRNR